MRKWNRTRFAKGEWEGRGPGAEHGTGLDMEARTPALRGCNKDKRYPGNKGGSMKPSIPSYPNSTQYSKNNVLRL